jgi:hypothetical protein
METETVRSPFSAFSLAKTEHVPAPTGECGHIDPQGGVRYGWGGECSFNKGIEQGNDLLGLRKRRRPTRENTRPILEHGHEASVSNLPGRELDVLDRTLDASTGLLCCEQGPLGPGELHRPRRVSAKISQTYRSA